LNANEIRIFMRLWKYVKSQLNEIYFERFPKLDFFIAKILEFLDIPKRLDFHLNSNLNRRYELI